VGALEQVPSDLTPSRSVASASGLAAEAAEHDLRGRTGDRQAEAAWLGVSNARDARIDKGSVQELLARLLAADYSLATTYVEGLVSAGVSIEAIYLDILAPTARLIGEYWEADRCDFVDVTVVVGRLQLLVRGLSRELTLASHAAPGAGRVLLSCIPGEHHTLGLFMAAEFFVRDGWSVTIGAPVATGDLMAIAGTQRFDVIGFSVGCDSRLGRLKREIARVRRWSGSRCVPILVGGRVADGRPELASRLGADAATGDATVGPRIARQLMMARPR
jgi:MerR family transcriptional regulator, light-induced transcriptional regulator